MVIDMNEIKAFVVLESNAPTEADARRKQAECPTLAYQSFPYQGLRVFPNIRGTRVHVFSPHSEAVLRALGWRKTDQHP